LYVLINGKNVNALYAARQGTRGTTGMDVSVLTAARQGIKSTPGIVMDQVFVGYAIKNANINGRVASVLSVGKLGTKVMIATPVWAYAKSVNRK